jgi:hypothetical protein
MRCQAKWAAAALKKTLDWQRRFLDPLTGAPRAACLHTRLAEGLARAAKGIVHSAALTQTSPTSPRYFSGVHGAFEALRQALPTEAGAVLQRRAALFSPTSPALRDLFTAFLEDLGTDEQDLIDFALQGSPVLQESFAATLRDPEITGVRLLATQCTLQDLQINMTKDYGQSSSLSVSTCLALRDQPALNL